MSLLSRVSHCFSSLSISLSSRHTLHLSSSQFSLASPLRLHRKRFAQRRTMKSSRLATLVPFCSSAAEHSVADSGANSSTPSPVQEDEDNFSSGVGYRLPPKEIRDIVDAPPLPVLSFSPQRDKILFLKRRALPPLSDLAKPEEKLAGVRIDGNSNARSRMSFYTGIGIHALLDDGSLGPEKLIYGYPEGAKINFVTWSRDGRHLSFAVRFDEEDNTSSKLTVWVADVDSGKARPLFNSPDVYLNSVFESFVWVNDSTLLVCTIPLSRGKPPKKPLVPSGPKIQSNEQQNVIQVRTFQDLLKDEYDADLFDYYATSQLVLASLDGTIKPIGPPAVYTSIDPSPDEKYVMVTSIHRPYSFIVPCGRFPKKVELWTTEGKVVRELCDLPLAEDIPIATSSVRKGKRSINWRPDKPSTLYWVETQDGGDAKVEVSPRDLIYTEPAEPLNGEQLEILHKLDLRYGGISWCDESLALVYESWYKTRKTRTWVVAPDQKGVDPRILFDRSSEDVYSDPGSPMMRRTAAGTYVIAKIKKDGDDHTYLLLNGMGATPEGNIPFLDLFDIETGSKERIWESDKEKYFESVVALMSDQTDSTLHLNQLKILTSKESKTENTQYFLQIWPEKKRVQITNFPHPYPQLQSLQKEMIRYKRKDGVQLTATLYLPPGYDPSVDGPLPCLVWSYPGEFKSKDAAGQVRGSPNEFAGIGATSPLLWLARRFAILSGPTIPIIGEGDEEANDRYVEQLVASAEAAVEEVVKRGVAHPSKIAVGGHSYGAFMTANLLAHAPHLFCCGVARSGAYNRTLTPFGFQNEDRTLWEATGIYVEMSPFMSANKIKKPILLIHGEEDNNSGTLTMQGVSNTRQKSRIKYWVCTNDNKNLEEWGVRWALDQNPSYVQSEPSDTHQDPFAPLKSRADQVRVNIDANRMALTRHRTDFGPMLVRHPPLRAAEAHTDNLESDRFFTALKGHGALCRLVILPYESHGYSARESIMHVLWETDRWLQKYCEANSDSDRSSNKDDSQNSTTAVNSENKALSASGGGAAHESSEFGEPLCTPRSLLW